VSWVLGWSSGSWTSSVASGVSGGNTANALTGVDSWSYRALARGFRAIESRSASGMLVCRD
jgi:hypothetical protein